MRCRKNNLIILLSFFVFSILLYVNVLSFEIWGQIVDYRSGYEARGGFYFTPHLLRYIVIHPVYELSSIFGLQESSVYSWYIFFSALCVSKLWDLIIKAQAGQGSSFNLSILFPFFLLFFINGRFIFCLLGLTIILYCMVILERGRFSFFTLAGVSLGLLLASVSSGVFFVGLSFFIWCMLDVYKKNPSFASVKMKWLLFFLLSLAFFMSWVFLKKNLTYFLSDSGSFLDMLSHGFGVLYVPYSSQELCGGNERGMLCDMVVFVDGARTLVSATVTIGFFFTLIFFKIFNFFSKYAVRGLFLSGAGGVFGVTTLMSFVFIIPVLFIGNRFMNK